MHININHKNYIYRNEREYIIKREYIDNHFEGSFLFPLSASLLVRNETCFPPMIGRLFNYR